MLYMRVALLSTVPCETTQLTLPRHVELDHRSCTALAPKGRGLVAASRNEFREDLRNSLTGPPPESVSRETSPLTAWNANTPCFTCNGVEGVSGRSTAFRQKASATQPPDRTPPRCCWIGERSRLHRSAVAFRAPGTRCSAGEPVSRATRDRVTFGALDDQRERIDFPVLVLAEDSWFHVQHWWPMNIEPSGQQDPESFADVARGL